MRRATVFLLFLAVCNGVWAQAQADPLAKANERLNAKDYKGAEQEFRAVTQKDAANVMAWFGLGQALQEQGNAQAALDAYNKVQNAPQGLAARLAFRQARAYAKLGQADNAFAALERAVKGGFASRQILDTTTDLQGLQADPRYKKLLETMDAKARPCMHDPRYRAFDFWVGEWDVRPTGQPGAPPSRSSIQSVLEGCVVFEQYTSNNGTYYGKSFNIFDAATGRWYQHYVDSTGARLELDGEVRDNVMYYTGMNPNAAGQKVHDRLTFFKLANGHVRQLWEQSPDGKEWTVIFDGEYSPKSSSQ
jgi:tetratricopeptide (TPR) repeat protein